MKITVIGSGYVGLVTGASLANSGHIVTCVDIDPVKIHALNQGKSPIWEPGLDEMIANNIAQERLFFTTNLESALKETTVVFIAVGTPQAEDGSADLKYVTAVAQDIGRVASGALVVAVKSTVPVGTGTHVQETINEELSRRHVNFEISVCSNPEFLKEGTAIADFKHGDRIIIGVSNAMDEATMREVYEPFNRNHEKIIIMDIRSSELAKYAANAMLATKISFMNELSRIAEATGADIDSIRVGIGSDPRIGNKFLYAGAGYGGSCFPKDVKALAHTAVVNGCDSALLRATDSTNEKQKKILFAKLESHLKDFKKQKIAVWGLAFKPKTDDVREAPSLELINSLLKVGLSVTAYDPVATASFQKMFGSAPSNLRYSMNALDALEGADALIICTEWEEFRVFNGDELKKRMKGNLIVDGRNLYPPHVPAKEGFVYSSIGRATAYPHN